MHQILSATPRCQPNNLCLRTARCGQPQGFAESGLYQPHFIEEQIFNWTYSDEQRAKENWASSPLERAGGEANPYASLPRMVILTYQLPDSIREIAMKGEYNEFDLNVFFTAEGDGKAASFKYENEVQKWLDLIRGFFRKPLSTI